MITVNAGVTWRRTLFNERLVTEGTGAYQVWLEAAKIYDSTLGGPNDFARLTGSVSIVCTSGVVTAERYAADLADGLPVAANPSVTGGVTKMVSMTQAAYTALAVKDPATLYLIVG